MLLFLKLPRYARLIFKLILMNSMVFLLSPLSYSQSKAPPIKTSYEAQKVSNSVYVIHGPVVGPNPENQGFMNNPAFIIGDDGIIVVDAGSTVQVGDMVLNKIKSISNLPVVATFSTHIHGDHWLGNQAIAEAYPDAKHYAHPQLIKLANEGEGDSWVALMETLTEGASIGTEYFAPTDNVDEGTQINVAGKTFSIFHDPIAHTNTDIAIRFDNEAVMFFGDTVFNGRLGRLDDGGFKGLIAFLDRMLALDIKVFIPGHGATGNAQVVKTYKDVISIIFNTVKEEYDNGLADYEMKPIVEAKIANKAQWNDIEESLGKFISLAYLEVENDAF